MMEMNVTMNSLVCGLKHSLDEAMELSTVYGIKKETLSFFDSRVVAYVLRMYGDKHECASMIKSKLELCGDDVAERVLLLQEFILEVEYAGLRAFSYPKRGIFIGHGESADWKELKDFLQEKLKLEWEDFDRNSGAGISVSERMFEILDHTRFAFMVLTSKDIGSFSEATILYEIALFRGRLGPRKAILIIEEGCSVLSDRHHLSSITFKQGNITNCFEEIRDVLKREKIIS